MSGLITAQRYAKGFMQFVKDTDDLDIAYAEMIDISKTVKENEDLKSFLKSPIIEISRKEAVLKEVFKSFSKSTITFISLVVRHRREDILYKIADKFIENYNLMNNIITAEITSVVELDQKTINNIIEKTKKSLSLDGKVNVVNKINKSLIGGFVLKIGHIQIDSSIRTKLSRLKKDFSN